MNEPSTVARTTTLTIPTLTLSPEQEGRLAQAVMNITIAIL